MANERVRGNDIGATGETVAANLARVRKSQQISLQDLEQRLIALGRRISFSGLSKIERGERRVDVDDLMALAIALDVSPLGLLLPVDQEPAALVETSGARGSLALFWKWVLGESTPFSRDDRAFTARSVPWWLEETGGEIEWFGDLELRMGRSGEELQHQLTISYRARTAAEMNADFPLSEPWRVQRPGPGTRSVGEQQPSPSGQKLQYGELAGVNQAALEDALREASERRGQISIPGIDFVRVREIDDGEHQATS